jgi:alpha-mannosidase
MSLTAEWSRRLDNWRRELASHFYRPLGEAVFQGFASPDRLTPSQAERESFHPVSPGQPWGKKWEYGWFRARIALPPQAAGKRTVLAPDFGAEALVFINGVAAEGKDREHSYIPLSRSARPGMAFDILAEAYAGHGPVEWTPGPVPPGRAPMPEPENIRAILGKSTFGIWEEELYQLSLDVETLFLLRQNIDPDSLRVSEIDAGLRDFTVILDFEVPRAEMHKSAGKCRARLAPLLAKRNGPTSPVLHAVGHAHIDLAWLWPIAETERKAARTFSTQLSLMQEYPGFKFLQSTPCRYAMLKRGYPELYARVRKAVKSGSLVPEGVMWVEADTNIPGGESLIRQIFHGLSFFRKELGVESRILWLPDVFGFSASLPQILGGFGLRYFFTAKIPWAYNGGDPFPYTTFRWQGIDGSEALAHFASGYNYSTDPAAAIRRWNGRAQKDGISTCLLPFGYGDGGGGPTRDHLELARRLEDLEGAPRMRISHPLEFFREQDRAWESLPRYVGELYFQAHRGAYTSQARIKREIRMTETALREAELWAVFAHAAGGSGIPRMELEDAWRLALQNQFHDIAAGTSIPRVHEEALAELGRARAAAEHIARGAAAGLAGPWPRDFASRAGSPLRISPRPSFYKTAPGAWISTRRWNGGRATSCLKSASPCAIMRRMRCTRSNSAISGDRPTPPGSTTRTASRRPRAGGRRSWRRAGGSPC